MAQRVQVLLVDDLDGGDASETVSFALDGVTYEIDLSESNAAKFRDDLASWIGHARRSGGRRATGGTRRAAPGSTRTRSDLGAIREWARANGHQVSDRGRISAEVQEAYDKANALSVGPVGGARTRLAALAAAPVRDTHERVRGGARLRGRPGQPAHRLAGPVGAGARLAPSLVLRAGGAGPGRGADPTAPWRSALHRRTAQTYGTEPPRHVAAAFVLLWYLDLLAQPAAYACALGPWVLDVAPEAVRFDLAEPELFPCAVSVPPDGVADGPRAGRAPGAGPASATPRTPSGSSPATTPASG